MIDRSRDWRTGLTGAVRLAVAAPFYLAGLGAMSISVAARGALVAGGVGLVLAGVAAGSVPGPMPTVGYVAIGVLVGGLAFVGFVARARRELRTRLRIQPAALLLSAHAPGNDAEKRARGTLERLARQVDLPVPALRVVRTDRPVCFSLAYPAGSTPVELVEETLGIRLRRRSGGGRGGGGGEGPALSSAAFADPVESDHVVVVSTGMLAALDDPELEAVLAHEVAHLRNGDLALMNRLLVPVAWAESALGDLLDRDAERGGIRGALLGTPRAVLVRVGRVTALGATLPAVAAINRGREFAADRGAAEITGSPASLASALETLADDRPETPARDLRAAAVVNVVAPGDGLPFSHPATEKRIERLRAIEVDGDAGRTGR